MKGFGYIELIIVVAVLATVGALAYGVNNYLNGVEARGYQKAKAECEEAARIQREAEIGRANLAATELEKSNERSRTVYRTITKTVDRYIDRPVYRNVCLDVDGLRDANAALVGARTPAGESDGRMPQPLSASGRDGGIGAAQAR